MSNFNNKLDDIENQIGDLSKSYHEIDKSLAIVCNNLENHAKEHKHNMELVSKSLENIDSHLRDYGIQLTIHIQGVKEAQENNRILREELVLSKQKFELESDVVNKRLETLELPIKWFQSTKRIAAWITAVLGAVATIGAALHWMLKVV